MSRVKRGPESLRKKKRILKKAKGYRGARSKLIRTAKEAVQRALAYSYRDRKKRGLQFRRLWTVRINAATRERGLTYSQFIHGLKMASIVIDRKMLAELAVSDPPTFGKLVEVAAAQHAKKAS